MTKVLIPSNTNNYISKISEHRTEFKTTTLFLGSLQATDPHLLREYRIAAILTIGVGLEVTVPLGVTHKTIKIQDSTFENIAQYFSECNDFIKKQLDRGNVLVHCLAGISRSATIVLAYTMKTKKIRLSKAIQKIKESRSVINPNQGFMLQLKQYERKLGKALEQKNLKLK